jgi:hypothetical protein
MIIKIRYVSAILFVSIGCILSFYIKGLAYFNWYCLFFGFLMSDPIISKKPFSFNNFISMMIYIWITVLIYIIRSSTHDECLNKFISSPNFLITLWLFAIFVIIKRYIEEKEKTKISSQMSDSSSTGK